MATLSDCGARFLIQGERGLVVEFGQTIDPDILARVHSVKQALQSDPPPGLCEMVPTYRSLMIVYDPLITTADELIAAVLSRWPAQVTPLSEGRVVVVPVCYGGDFGPDLDELSQMVGLSSEDVIAEHTSRDYLIYMLGFTPGFPYLGGLSPRIACPRLSSPRTLVPIGSVGIAEQQTGIYPLATPGGWRLIGRSPLKLFDPTSDTPFLLHAGDWMRFTRIDRSEYDRIASAVAEGRWQPVYAEARRGS